MNKTRIATLTTIGSTFEPKRTMDWLEPSRHPDDHPGLTELGL